MEESEHEDPVGSAKRSKSLDFVSIAQHYGEDNLRRGHWMRQRSKSFDDAGTNRAFLENPSDGKQDNGLDCAAQDKNEGYCVHLDATSATSTTQWKGAAAILDHIFGTSEFPKPSSERGITSSKASRRRPPDSSNKSPRHTDSRSGSREKDNWSHTERLGKGVKIRNVPALRLPKGSLENLRQNTRDNQTGGTSQEEERDYHYRSESREYYRRRRDLSECSHSSTSVSSYSDDDKIQASRRNDEADSAWVANLEAVKRRYCKKFIEVLGPRRISGSQWIAAFRVHKAILFGVIYAALGTLDPKLLRGVLGDTEFRETHDDVFLNAARDFVNEIGEAIHRPKSQDVSLEKWLLGRLRDAFHDQFVGTKVGSKAQFVKKWDAVMSRYPEVNLERKLVNALDSNDQILRKWLEPNVNTMDARSALELVFEDPVQLKARVLLVDAVDPRHFFIAMSQSHPDLFAILDRIHTIDKNIDRVLYGMPIGKKSQAFLASQELGILEYFKCDEVSLSWRSTFAAVSFSLGDRSVGVQVSKSALKAKHYYDLILDAASLKQQSWLHDKLHKCDIDQEVIDFQIIERKWKTLQDFVHSARPKVRKMWELTQASAATAEAEPHLRRRLVRRTSLKGKSQEHSLTEEMQATSLSGANQKDASVTGEPRRPTIEHLITRLRHIRQKPSRTAILAFIVDRKTVLVLLPCFVALSAVFTGVSLVASTSDPNTSNFYEQLSSVSQMLFSLYCITVPLIRVSNVVIWSFWLCLAVATSAFAGILSIALFYSYQQASISISFVSGTAQIVATMLLIEGVDEVVRKPTPESVLLTRTGSRAHDDGSISLAYRPWDEEAFKS